MKFPLKISNKLIILEQRNHNHDVALWKAIKQNTDFIGKFLTWPHKMQELTDVVNATDKFIQQWNNNEKFAYCIMDKTDYDLLGMIDLQKINYQTQSAEIGYWLCQDKTGHGYISSALSIIENYALLNGICNLRIRCDAHNHASVLVAKRAGYVLEKTIYRAISYDTEFHNREIYLKTFL